jgi:hypothetical protein
VLSAPAVGGGRTSVCYTAPCFTVPALAGRSRRRYSSAACLCRSVGLLALGLIEGQDGDWTSWRVVAAFVAALAGFAACYARVARRNWDGVCHG